MYRLPQFIIAGTQKSGSTTLSDYLNIHPDIFVPNNELYFFENESKYDKGIEYYSKMFEQA